MIRYHLRCAEGHAFDSWFADAAAFDALRSRRLVSCAECGSEEVEKALMAPSVRPGRAASPGPMPVAEPAAAPPAAPASGGTPPPPAPSQGTGGAMALNVSPMEKAIAELRAKVEASSTYVGKGFAAEARAMHRGEKAEAPIWGEATREEARALREDGIPALPLPFGPRAKSN